MNSRGLGWCAFAALVCACGSEVKPANDDDGGGGSGNTGGQGGSGPLVGQPPSETPEAPPGDGPGATFAMRSFFFGDAERNFAPSANAWKQFGYNLDGIVTTVGSPEHCQPVAGGNPKIMDDGDGGIDNGFGKSLVPLFVNLQSDITDQLNNQIATGETTLLVDVPALGSGTPYAGLSAQVFDGAPLGATPAFDGSDVWPKTAESSAAGWTFLDSYVSDSTLVLAPRGTLSLHLGALEITLPLEQVLITMELSPDRAVASNGIIAGVIPLEPLIEEVRRMAGAFSQEFCSGPTIESLLDAIRRSADILSDGTQSPAATCDAISVGFGFEAVAVSLGPTATPVPPPPDPCNG